MASSSVLPLCVSPLAQNLNPFIIEKKTVGRHHRMPPISNNKHLFYNRVGGKCQTNTKPRHLFLPKLGGISSFVCRGLRGGFFFWCLYIYTSSNYHKVFNQIRMISPDYTWLHLITPDYTWLHLITPTLFSYSCYFSFFLSPTSHIFRFIWTSPLNLPPLVGQKMGVL